MARDTKDRILDAALEIFARDGYSGTNLKDIAEAVGIVKSALYRHYESKEELWKAVQDMMVSYYDARFGTMEKLPGLPESTDELREMTFRMIDFTVHDKKVIQMRKILLTEQFRDERIRAFASNYFLTDTKAIFTRVFEKMMDAGCLKKADAEVLAFAYTAPITSLIHLCDREPDKEPEAMRLMRQFVQQFIDTYGTEKN